MTTAPTLRQRYAGALLGLACGDAVGTTVEFRPRGSFAPVTDMTGGGPFGLAAGQWTDDTSMALCLAESLVTLGAFDAADQMQRYVRWWRSGHMSSTGTCFDIGGTTCRALARFERSGDAYAGSTDPRTAGNGSLMRLAPVVLFAYPDAELAVELAAQSSRTTHAAPEAVESCRLLAAVLCGMLRGLPKQDLLGSVGAAGFVPTQRKMIALATGSFAAKHRDAIRGSGYCIESLEAALWCFFGTDDFESAILRAANLGDDADTTGAIVGQLAGAHYGADAIPRGWIAKLAMAGDIEQLADALCDRARSVEAAAAIPPGRSTG